MPVRELVDHFANVLRDDLGRAGHRAVALRAHQRPDPCPQRVDDPPAGLRRRLDREARVRGSLLRRLRAFPDRARPGRRQVSRPRARTGAAARVQLLLPDEPRLRLAARSLRTQPGVPAPGALPQRGARDAARRIGPRRSLDLATEDASRLGHRAALRPRPRLLRLVRRADLLSDRRRLSRRSRFRRSAGRAPST